MDLKAHQKKWNEYVEDRRSDFNFYIDRSDLSMPQMSESTGIPLDWIKQSKVGIIKQPGDHRMTILIEFMKDFERLQTYYSALAR